MELKRCQVEITHLRRTVEELEKSRGEWERGKQEGRGERERLMTENDELRRRLEGVGVKVEKAEERWRVEKQAKEQAVR